MDLCDRKQEGSGKQQESRCAIFLRTCARCLVYCCTARLRQSLSVPQHWRHDKTWGTALRFLYTMAHIPYRGIQLWCLVTGRVHLTQIVISSLRSGKEPGTSKEHEPRARWFAASPLSLRKPPSLFARAGVYRATSKLSSRGEVHTKGANK